MPSSRDLARKLTEAFTSAELRRLAAALPSWADFCSDLPGEATVSPLAYAEAVITAFERRKEVDLLIAAARVERPRSDEFGPPPDPSSQEPFVNGALVDRVLAELDAGARRIAVIGVSGVGAARIVREVQRRRGARLVTADGGEPGPTHDPLVCVVGHPKPDWVARLAGLAAGAVVVAIALPPETFTCIVVPPLDDAQILACLGAGWQPWLGRVVEATGRYPGAVRQLIGPTPASRAELEARISEHRPLVRRAYVGHAAVALATATRAERTVVHTLAVRAARAPIALTLVREIVTEARLDPKLLDRPDSALRAFLDVRRGDGGQGSVSVRASVGTAILEDGYRDAQPTLALAFLRGLCQNPERLVHLLATLGPASFRFIVDDARTLALAGQPKPNPGDAVPGYLTDEYAQDVRRLWRVLANVAQLIPTPATQGGEVLLWQHLHTAATRLAGARLDGAAPLLTGLREAAVDALAGHPHWELRWIEPLEPGQLRAELPHVAQVDGRGVVELQPEVNAVRFDPDGQSLWTGDSTGRVQRWTITTNEIRAGKKPLHTNEIWSIELCGEDTVAAASDDGTIGLRAGGVPKLAEPWGYGMVNAVAAGPNHRLLAGDDDGVLSEWTWSNHGEPSLSARRVVGQAEGWVLSLVYPEGGLILSAHSTGELRAWRQDAESGTWSSVVEFRNERANWARTLRYDPVGRRTYASFGDGTVARREPDGQWHVLFDHGASVRGLALLDTPERRIATGGDDGVIRIWSEDGARLAAFGAHDGMIRALDGRGARLASAGTDGFARVWDVGASPGELPEFLGVGTDHIVVRARGRTTLRLASTGKPTDAEFGEAKPGLPVAFDRGRLEARGVRVELPTAAHAAVLSEDQSTLLAMDVGHRLYCFAWGGP